MNFLISGGTGFIGKKLSARLHKEGHHTYILTRSLHNKTNTIHTTYIRYDQTVKDLPVIHGVINLAGESLFGYWTRNKKQSILKSRIETTEKLLQITEKLEPKPLIFINGSAIGYYGMNEDMMFTEKTTTPGSDFLANVVTKWEKKALQAEQLGIRTVFARFGVVLGDNGALPLMTLPLKLFIGGKLGNGDQWMSWIHIDDATRLLLFSIQNEKISGPLNITAPNPLRNKDFIKTMAKVLNRPYWFHTPSLLIRSLTGEMSQLVLKGQYVLPMKAIEANFEFLYPYLEDALRDIYQKKRD